MDCVNFNSVLEEFVAECDNVYGIYLDATKGFSENVKTMQEAQLQSPASIDSLRMSFGHGNPNDPKSVVVHRTTIGEFKERNAKDGKNEIYIGQYTIVLIYEYWDVEYRPRIAQSLNASLKDIVVPILGDMRRLRNDILHHKGITTSDTEKKIENFNFKEGELIKFSDDEMRYVINLLKTAIDNYSIKLTQYDPNFRGRLKLF